MAENRPADVIRLPGQPTSVDIALDELEVVYAFVFRRVGNRADAEDVTQQVALKAVPRLHADASRESIRAYLFATAKTELAGFWAARFGMPASELRDDVTLHELDEDDRRAPVEKVEQVLRGLPEHYARLLELRFLRGYTTKEVARELGTTVGAVRIMQLRALRAAAKVMGGA
ncbi:MAG TPA: sigma-70 family RNA polymerase sigma factor [Candidatus Dormibacteraeota bacterium]|jgi:RNA polymerase sigma-70 factor (ECF subfamily)|nr:sigma-70 family RNA polymerase sigma factor [Candidatus Dormibacteraeota bacterium]